jgi:uncharacterized protein
VADPTAEDLDALLELQATDHRVRKAEHQLDALTEQRRLDDAEARVAALRAKLDEITAKLERSEVEQRTLERDIDTLTARRDAERARLYDGSVTNQREMSSVEAEIESTERRRQEHEEDLLTVLERVEELESRQATLGADLDAADREVEAALAARDGAAKATLAELPEARAARDRRASALPPELLQRYVTAAARGGGTGVGELTGLACSACRIEMSMADVDELYRGPSLTTCPQCRRLLVVRA